MSDTHKQLVWATVICPRCQREVAIGVMSLAATCPCGAYYADVPAPLGGWYASVEAYTLGEEPL
jgi:hypothetical protein